MRNSFRHLCDACYAKLNELGLVWGAFSFRLHNDPYVSHWFSFLLHSLFLTQSHSPLHHRVNPNSITNTLYHSHKLIGPHSSENGEVTSNAILNRGKSIDSRSSSSRSFSIHTHYFDLSFYHSLFHSILSHKAWNR